jgi:diacylglycerol O-acyltransferase / wax synthase
MRQLTSLDAQFLAMESARVTGHVGGLAIYDPSTAPGGTLSAADLCRVVGERLHLLRPFRWRLVSVPLDLDHPYWVEDPDFDLDFHIRESAVPPPGTDRQLAETVARIFARPLDRTRPLWELYLIHGLPEGRVGMLTKIHHAAVDGVSGAEILGLLLDPSPEGREVPPPAAEHRGERVPGQLEMLGRGALGIPRQQLRALRALPTMGRNIADFPGLAALPGMGAVGRVTDVARRALGPGDGAVLERPSTSVPRTVFNGRVSAHRRFAFGTVSLDRIKAIKNALGITVNDVVVATCASAVRAWLLQRDELPDEPLVAMIPVSVRTREQSGTFGNRVSMMLAPIPTDEPDPRARLLRAHEVLRSAKERHGALPAELLQDATQFIPPAIHARASRVALRLGAANAMRPVLNLVISNVPGPRTPLFCAGAKLLANYPVSVISDGAGLNMTCMSYRDGVDFGIVADREQAGDAWPILDAVRDALDELDTTVCGGGRRPAHRTPQPLP